MTDEAVNQLANYVLFAGFVPALAFFLDYVLVRPFRGYSPWWESAIGVMFASLAGALVLLGGIVLASLFIGTDYPGRSVVRLIGYASFTAALLQLLVVYLLERRSPTPILFKRKDKHERRGSNPHPGDRDELGRSDRVGR